MSQQKPPADNIEGLAGDKINAYTYKHFLLIPLNLYFKILGDGIVMLFLAKAIHLDNWIPEASKSAGAAAAGLPRLSVER